MDYNISKVDTLYQQILAPLQEILREVVTEMQRYPTNSNNIFGKLGLKHAQHDGCAGSSSYGKEKNSSHPTRRSCPTWVNLGFVCWLAFKPQLSFKNLVGESHVFYGGLKLPGNDLSSGSRPPKQLTAAKRVVYATWMQPAQGHPNIRYATEK